MTDSQTENRHRILITSLNPGKQLLRVLPCTNALRSLDLMCTTACKNPSNGFALCVCGRGEQTAWLSICPVTSQPQTYHYISSLFQAGQK